MSPFNLSSMMKAYLKYGTNKSAIQRPHKSTEAGLSDELEFPDLSYTLSDFCKQQEPPTLYI